MYCTNTFPDMHCTMQQYQLCLKANAGSFISTKHRLAGSLISSVNIYEYESISERKETYKYIDGVHNGKDCTSHIQAYDDDSDHYHAGKYWSWIREEVYTV